MFQKCENILQQIQNQIQELKKNTVTQTIKQLNLFLKNH